VLTVSRALEQKIIAIAAGEIAVVSEKLAVRSPLGELLVSRGRLTESQLQEALKVQRESQQRSRLGELLVKLGVIKPEDIAACLKFQVEEEICDLFTWKGATFEFDSEVSIDEACVDELGQFHLQRMFIDPQALIAEASRRMNEWKAIESRLPTPYLCFKLSPKGEELSPKANPPTQQLVKLVKEGRTLETIVKRSHVGRFNVCRSMIKLLDEGWIFPYPSAELPMLASEHRAHRRFSDALFIYRRLLDAASGDLERRELQSLINDTMQSIRKAQEAGELVEGVEVTSYKEAAERYKFRQTMKRVASLTFLGLALIVATWALSALYRPPPTLAEEYVKTMQSARELVRAHKYVEAAKIVQALNARIPDQTCFTAKLLQGYIAGLPLKQNEYIKDQLSVAQALEDQGLLDEAEQKYREMRLKYANSVHDEKIQAGLSHVAETRRFQAEAKDLEKLRAHLAQAKKLMQQSNYAAARELFQRLARSIAAGAPEHKEVQEGLAKIEDLETQVARGLEDAKAKVRAHKGEEALAAFAEAAKVWPDLPIAEEARQQKQILKARLDQLTQELQNAEALAAQGGMLEALDALLRLQRDFPEFEKQTEVAKRVEEYKARVGVLDAQIKQAQEAYGQDKERGRQLYANLLKEQFAFVAARKAEVPVQITSLPSGAAVKIDGQAKGTTPLDVLVIAGQPFTVAWEKQGYDRIEQQVTRLAPENLFVIRVTLSRTAQELDLKTAILAPPVVLGGQLYVLPGTALTVLDPAGKGLWSLPGLLDDTATTRPNSDGSGQPQFVNERTWWYPRTAPEPSDEGKLVLPLRSREVVEVDIPAHSARKLVAGLPVEPVGRAHLERDKRPNGRTLLAVGCADGRIRTYDLAQPAVALWEKPADPANPAPKGMLATGLASRQNGTFLALSASGRLSSFKTLNGQEELVLDVQAQLAPANVLPGTPQENLAALVLADGSMKVVDVSRREMVWGLSVAQGFDACTQAAITGEALYVISRDGVVRKFPRDKPKALWNRPLDGGTEAPLAIGRNLYAVSSFGTLYALALSDGRELWQYKVKGTATHIVEQGNLLYVATREGRLLIMAAE